MSASLLGYDDAAAVVRARAIRFAAERPLADIADLGLAVGRVLAEPLHADRDQPPFARSTRDGFAGRAADFATHDWLPIAGSIRAGQAPADPLDPHTVVEIMTGAPVPEGADAVVMLEHVQVENGRLHLAAARAVTAGDNIVLRGTEAAEGDVLIPAGTRLAAHHIALAAACGHSQLAAFTRPKVAVLATGDELVSVQSKPGPGQIRNSNSPMLAAMISAAGGKPLILPIAPDDPESLDDAIAQAASSEMLVVTGGVSAGKFDLVEDALVRAGATFHFTGARIQPGKPVVFGEIPRGHGPGARSQPCFGLPGNPISSAATFLLFAAPILAALSGNAEFGPRFALARLAKDCAGKPGLTRFVPAACSLPNHPCGSPTVTPVGWQGSGDLAAFACSNCFLVVPEGIERITAGETVRTLLA